METTRSQTSWTLSAPASMVMLTGENGSDPVVLRLMLLELIVRRSLNLSIGIDRQLRLFQRPIFLISSGFSFGRRVDGSFQSVLALIPALKSRSFENGAEGIPIQIS